MDNIQIFLFAGALAIALAGTYIIWGPNQRTRRNTKVPGLQNLGKSCFLNAVLQALSACPLFICWLKNVVELQRGKGDDSSSLCAVLFSLLKDLNSNCELCNAAEVIHALRRKRWAISNEEEDAHELLHVLTTTLEEEIADIPPILSLLEVAKLEAEAAKCIDNDLLKKPFLVSSDETTPKNTLPIRGLLANQLTCNQCGYKYPVKYDTFDSISLSIPSPSWGPLKLQDCLEKFVSCEQVSGVTCDFCCKKQQISSVTSNAKATFIKQLSFGKLPDCLCFHIQRTVWMSNGMPAKCFEHVQFPEILYMDNFLYKSPTTRKPKSFSFPQITLTGGSKNGQDIPQQSELIPKELKKALQTEISANVNGAAVILEKSLPSSEHVYILKAVVVHVGDILSGHFVTYRRGPYNSPSEKKWFFTSDCSTGEVPFSEVAKVCAYMLFYEKLQQNKGTRRPMSVSF